MDAADTLTEALTQLTAFSAEIRSAALVDSQGAVLAATSAADGERLAKAARDLFATAGGVAHVEVGLARGSVFAVRDGEQVAVATTSPEPASALVLHDLRALLQRTVDA